MVKRPKERLNEQKWHNLQFERFIGPTDVSRLCRHLVGSLVGDCQISLRTVHEDDYFQRNSKNASSQRNSIVYPGQVELYGSIHRRANGSRLSFNFLNNGEGRPNQTLYDTIHLFEERYSWKELSTDSQDLVRDIRTQIRRYFSRD